MPRLHEFYASNARFKDPFNDVVGVPGIERVFAHMFDALDEPRFVVHDDFLLGALFVRPRYSHYYFGDYFEPVYVQRGFTAWMDFRIMGRGRIAVTALSTMPSRRTKNVKMRLSKNSKATCEDCTKWIPMGKSWFSARTKRLKPSYPKKEKSSM